MSTALVDRKTPQGIKRLSLYAALLTGLIGLLALIGWTFNLTFLKSISAEWVSMKANLAVSFIILALALWCFHGEHPSKGRWLLGKTLASAVLAAGGLTLFEDIARINLGIDEILFQEPPDPAATGWPGRMAPTSALGLIFMGLGLLVLGQKNLRIGLAQPFAIATGLLGLMTVLGYVFGLRPPYGIASYTLMSFHGGIAFILSAISLFAIHPAGGFLQLITSPYAGGILIRQLLPLSLVTVIGLRWLVYWGELQDLYPASYGIVLFVLSVVILLSALTYISSLSLDKQDEERKKALATLEQSEARKSAILESALDAIITIDKEGKIIECNAVTKQILGYHRDEMLGQEMARLIIPERYREGHRKGLEQYLMTGEGPILNHRIELHALHADGHEFPTELAITSIEEAEGPVFTGTLRDISQEKDAQERLIRHAHQNRALAELGLKTLSELPQQELLDQATRMLADILDNEYAKVLELMPDESALKLVAGVGWKEGLAGHAIVSIGKDSQAGYTLASKEPVIVEDLRTETRFSGPPLLREHQVISGMSVIIYVREKPWGVLGSHSTQKKIITQDDIYFLQAVANLLGIGVERRESKEELERLVSERTQQLETVNKELEAFAYSVSHDLRTPLRTIDGFSQAIVTLYENALDERGKDYLNRIREGCKQMSTLIDDMLQLSRLTRGDLNIEECVDLSSMAKAIAREYRLREPDRQVTFDIEDNLVARGDPRLLHAALQNLLDNSWKYTSKHPRAHIEVGKLENGVSIYFVKDDGAGFNMQYADKLFGAFQRLHGGHEFEGTGVGLATVARIVHRHGGEIWGEGEIEKGATFYFTLEPIVQQKEKTSDHQRPGKSHSTH